MITPSGRYLGRRPDTSDPNDHKFLAAHPEAARKPLPPSVDLRRKMPGVFDQGDEGSCELNAMDALLCCLRPKDGPFSRHQMYYDVRQIEGTGSEDAGCETRDVFKSVAKTGAAPEHLWPYEKRTFAPQPTPDVYAEAAKYKLARYSRLTSTSDCLYCLADGRPFVIGVTLRESFDGRQIDETGVMTVPKSSEKDLGGHAMLVVGYILNFRTDPLFQKTGLTPDSVSNEMLLVRNSWGPSWSRHFRGHFFMPLSYAMDLVTGNDAWTGSI